MVNPSAVISITLAVVIPSAVISKASVVVAAEVRVSKLPSKVRLASPLIPPAPSAVVTRLLPSFAKEAPLAPISVATSEPVLKSTFPLPSKTKNLSVSVPAFTTLPKFKVPATEVAPNPSTENTAVSPSSPSESSSL